MQMQANVQLKRDVEVPPSGGLWLGNENPFADIFDPADRAKGWLTAFDAETGNVRWKYHAPHPMLAGVTPTAVGLVFAADL
jgi:alcohol dehydrogenase (cytochrome c)